MFSSYSLKLHKRYTSLAIAFTSANIPFAHSQLKHIISNNAKLSPISNIQELIVDLADDVPIDEDHVDLADDVPIAEDHVDLADVAPIAEEPATNILPPSHNLKQYSSRVSVNCKIFSTNHVKLNL